MYKLYLFFSVKAVSTNFAWFESDGSHHIVETMIPQRSKVQLFADLVEHLMVVMGIRVCVVFQDCFRHGSFPLLDHTAGDQRYLHPYNNGGHAGRICTSFAPLSYRNWVV